MRKFVQFILICALGVASQDTVAIAGGSFWRGDSTSEASDEKPVRQIQVDPFFITTTEITEKQYQQCVDAGGCTEAHYDDSTCLMFNGERFIKTKVPPAYRSENFPVVCVSWQQARQYCRWRGMQLPSEVQWEFAARSESSTVYSWGDSASELLGRYNSALGPAEVGYYPPGNYGLYDMTGNAWEWVEDRYIADWYADTSGATSPDVGRYRVVRGGGWYANEQGIRAANRHRFSPTDAEVSIGFRCVE